MTPPADVNRDERILVLAPTGNDARLAANFLQNAGLVVEICRNVPELLRQLANGCGALLLAEETLSVDVVPLFTAALARQPSWSDLPIGLVTSGGELSQQHLERLRAFGQNANVTLLERPFRPMTLVRTFEVALRTRRRQYQFRDLLSEVQTNGARIRRILEQTAVGIAETDLTGRFTLVNDRYCEIVRRSREQLLAMHMRDLVYPNDVNMSVERFQALIAGQMSSYVIEKRYIDPNGVAVWVQDHISGIRGHDDVICGITIASADITERKAAEEAAMRARDEAVAASRAKDAFVAALSHELRTPLNPVLLLASDGAQNPDYSAAARADFENIVRNVSLEARLIDDLLDLTRITQGKLTLERQRQDIHAILRDALSTVEADVRSRRIKLKLDLAASAPIVIGDAVRLQQIFWNVLKNAVKFTPIRGTIAVATRTELAPPRVVVTVTDNGVGMSPAELGRIFQAFAQGDHATDGGARRFGGLGLGLAISKSIVELHAGKITAHSEGRGTGATFTIELPLVASAIGAPAPDLAPPAAPAPTGESATSSGPRVLLVEDHDSTRNALMTLLTRRNFEVFPAGSVREALVIAGHVEIDLLVSDIGLPDGSGYDLMRDLRAVHGLRGIALTGYGMDQDIALSREAGFTAHLTKPVDVRSLDKALDLVKAPTTSNAH